ncbi:hypothetical protein [Novosphingobium gossypii]|uniref:hypothetical protein n=1 Tax=Novosphingobium gossypii TaxID=1604774 RepID=UPI003D1D15EE
MQNNGRRDPSDPGSRRKGRAAITVVAIVLALIVAIFVGRNIWHQDVKEQEEAPGQMATGGTS